MDPKDLNTNYPESDIIVFHNPYNQNELRINRIIVNTTVGNKYYFFVKGDGESFPDTWPTVPKPNQYSACNAVSQDLIVGKVAARVPWVGHLSVILTNRLGVSGDSMVIMLIINLIIIFLAFELGLSLLRRKATTVGQ